MAKYIYTTSTVQSDQERGFTYRTTTAGRGTKVHLHRGAGNSIICGSSLRTGYHTGPTQEVTCTKCLTFLEGKLADGGLVRVD